MKRPRRRMFVAAAMVAALLGAGSLLALADPAGQRRINRRQWQAAKPGMTLAEVEALFGGPAEPTRLAPDPANPGSVVPVLDAPDGGTWYRSNWVADPDSTWLVWRGNTTHFAFRFKNGVLVENYGGISARATPLDRLRDRLYP